MTEQISRVLPKAIIAQGYGKAAIMTTPYLVLTTHWHTGITEAATGATFPALGQRVSTPGCSGVLLPGVSARVVKADGSLAGLDELGELHLKLPSISLGYLNNPTA